MTAPKKAVTDPKALKNIMLSLQRLMKIGVYYPPGHFVLERAIQQFRQHLLMVAGDNPSIRFSIRDGKLYLQDILLDTNHFFTHEFRETLTGLAIKHLHIDREILPEEIHKFIQSLLVYRAKYKAIKGFAQICLEDLPFSVRISQKEYLAAETNPDHHQGQADGTQPSLEVLLESLKGHELSSKQLDQCRHLLESVSLQPVPPVNEDSTSPPITWADIERLIVKLVNTSEEQTDVEAAKSRQELKTLASILESMGEKSTSKSSREAIGLLVSLVKENSEGLSGTLPKNKQIPAGENAQDGSDIDDIKDFLRKNEPANHTRENMLRPDRCETLTIVLQLLRHKNPLQIQYRLQQILREILTSDLRKEEWSVLSHGVLQLLNVITDCTHLSIIMAMITDPLRRSTHASSLPLYEKVGNRCNQVELKKLLPYIINELLVMGRQESPDAFDVLCNKILYLPTTDITATFPVLFQLDAFEEDKIAQNLFFSLPKTAYPIFAPLINTGIHKLLIRRIFQAFSNTAPDWLIEALLPFLNTSNALNRQFYHEYLKEPANPDPTKKLKALAGKIVARGLPAVSEEKRHHLALIKTIKSIPKLKDARLRPVLESIVNEKHLLIIPQWPPHCRKAAKEALSAMERNRRSR